MAGIFPKDGVCYLGREQHLGTVRFSLPCPVSCCGSSKQINVMALLLLGNGSLATFPPVL